MVHVDVHSLVGNSAITWDDGHKVYDLIYPALLAGDCVTLDFRGVEAFGAPFLNAAIGNLLEGFSRASLERLLQVDNLDPDMAFVVKVVIDDAEQYYSDPKVRAAVDKAIDRFAEETETL